MTVRIVHLAAVLLVALCFVPSGAHLFAMPTKMTLDRHAYFTVQQIYNGWALFGFVQAAALIATLAAAWLERATPLAMGFAAASAGLIVATLVAFFMLTYPGNVATQDWTVQTSDWEALRLNWEVGHATGAILMFLSLAAATVSAMASRG